MMEGEEDGKEKKCSKKHSQMNDVDKMSGVQFEHFLKLFFEQKGYKVKDTNVTGDFGADLVLVTRSEKIIIHAKRYNSRVGIKAVQEAVSAIKYYDASKAWVVTNSEFTGAAIELARSNSVKLIERDELINMIAELNGNDPSDLVAATQTVDDPIIQKCRRCGSKLVLRKGRKGDFYGCDNFPKCRYTENIV